MAPQTIQLEGKAYVVVPRDEFEQLQLKAKVAELPPLPPKNKHGRYPAEEFIRIGLARKIITARAELGLTQRELAKRAGIRVETLCRLESGQTMPSIPTVDKIDRALQSSAGAPKPRRRKPKPLPS
ncbi:MAG: helix-turn-helix domain-containing protein [Planctomycetaceae bacterium]|nr:helix-turn-helix domain-containing protein [Planctomycetaceae bacterium]